LLGSLPSSRGNSTLSRKDIKLHYPVDESTVALEIDTHVSRIITGTTARTAQHIGFGYRKYDPSEDYLYD